MGRARWEPTYGTIVLSEDRNRDVGTKHPQLRWLNGDTLIYRTETL